MSDLSHTTDTAPGPDDAPVRFGVIGAGFIARWFAEAVAREPAAQIVAVTSARRERAVRLRRGAPNPTFPRIARGDARRPRPGSANPIDVVYVGSPNALHAEHAITALEAGFHVLVEKPFALTTGQARAMVDAAGRADRFLMEGWLSAFEPGVAQVREALGRLDRLHRVVLSKEQFSSRMEAYRAGSLPPAFDPALGGGSLMDLGIYPVSLAIHLFGKPDRVTATGEILDSGVDVRGTVVLSYDSGEYEGLEVVCLHSKTSPGTESTFAADHDVLSIDDCQWPERIELRGPAADRSAGEDRQAHEDLSVERTAQRPGHQLAYELAEVCRLVRAGARESDLHPLSSSVAAIAVLEEARRQVGVRFPVDEQD